VRAQSEAAARQSAAAEYAREVTQRHTPVSPPQPFTLNPADSEKELHRLIERQTLSQAAKEGAAKAAAQVALGGAAARTAPEEKGEEKVRFLAPKGTQDPEKAKDFTVKRKVKVEWKPEETITLQCYQGGKLVKEWANLKKSGFEVELPGTGQSELK